jgi:hypothetical protein
MVTKSVLSFEISEIAGKGVNIPVLTRELEDAGLVGGIVSRDITSVYVEFATLLTPEQETTCNTTVLAHQALPFNATDQDANDPTEKTIIAGADWVDVGEFDTGPLPAGKYATQWSSETMINTEAIGNRIEVHLLMWYPVPNPGGGYIMMWVEVSNEAHNLPAWQKYQDGAWISRRAGESFKYKIQARSIGCDGIVRRVRFGLAPLSIHN